MMLSRRSLLASAIAALALLPSVSAHAGGEKFTDAAFEAAQKAGKPILVDVSAVWCPICRVQAPIVEDLAMSEKFKAFVHLEVDFDRQKDVMRRLNAPRQSTLIVFKGTVEIDRSVGDVNRQSIEAMMEKALK